MPRPSKPPLPAHVRRPEPLPLKARVRRVGVEYAQRFAASGLFGARQSRAVVICGMPRSGSTLLQLMVETAYPGSLHYGRERGGLLVARREWPGRHSLLISKRPNDVMWIDEIRDAYAGRQKKPCFIVTVRDPRAVLTSKHSGRNEYYVSPQRWRDLFEHIKYVRQFPDVTVVEYRTLVERPTVIERALVDAIGEEPSAPFDAFSTRVPEGFDTRALNGVRPLDTSALNKWRQPEHRDRIRALLESVPELPAVLVEEGYEPDESWAHEYR